MTDLIDKKGEAALLCRMVTESPQIAADVKKFIGRMIF